MTYRSILQMTASGIFPSLISAALIYLFYYKKMKQHSFAFGALSVYLCMLLYVTIYRYGIDIEELFLMRPHINLMPLVSTYQLYEYGGLTVFLYNIVGNIVWFLPFGFLLPFIQEKIHFRHVLYLSFGLSLGIEISQFLLNCGISDIDDIIFNVIGGGLGYGCYRMFGKNK